MFMSKDSRLAMGMGGTVRMRSYFDWGGAIAQPHSLRLSFGAEFNFGRREDFSGQSQWARRFGLLANFSF